MGCTRGCWALPKLALLLDAPVEDYVTNGQLVRLRFYLEKYLQFFDEVYLVSYDVRGYGELLPKGVAHLYLRSSVFSRIPLAVRRYLFFVFSPLLFASAFRRVDVVRLLSLNAFAAAVLVKIFFGKVVVVNYQFKYPVFAAVEGRSKLHVWLLELRERLFLRFFDAITVPTKTLFSYVAKFVGEEKIWVIPNGVITDLFPQAEERVDRYRVAFVGRLARQKNLFSLVLAAKILRDRGISIELLFVGDGPLRNELAALASELGVPLRIMGNISHDKVSSVLRSCSLFVLPSYVEGHPKALLEAMACGLPVVGTDVEGINEVISDGVNGLLASTEAKSLADKMQALLEDRELAKALGSSARQLVLEKYDLSRILEKECELMVNLVSR